MPFLEGALLEQLEPCMMVAGLEFLEAVGISWEVWKLCKVFEEWLMSLV